MDINNSAVTKTNGNRDSEVIQIDLLDIFGVIMHNMLLILLVAIMCALIGFGLSKFVITPTYESTTKIYILNKQDSNNVTYSDVQMGTQLTKDYAELINSRYVLEEVIQNLNLDIEYKDFTGKVKVSTPTDTRIVAITVSDTDPVMALNEANAIREVASSHIQNVMDIDAVNVVESANMPTEKAYPSVRNWTIIGLILGALLIIVIKIIAYLMDDTIKTSEDVERYLGLSTLALIPIENDSNGNKKKKTTKKTRR